jgi:hypothetical protein
MATHSRVQSSTQTLAVVNFSMLRIELAFDLVYVTVKIVKMLEQSSEQQTSARAYASVSSRSRVPTEVIATNLQQPFC